MGEYYRTANGTLARSIIHHTEWRRTSDEKDSYARKRFSAHPKIHADYLRPAPILPPETRLLPKKPPGK